MTARKGQVAIYLALVLIAIVFLTLGSVSAFLAVRAKNHTTNAGDAAALAVAKYQGELLNKIGQLNLDHLQLLLDCKRIAGESTEERLARMEACREACRRISENQQRICFLDPIEGIAIGNRYASDNGMAENEDMEKILKQHVIEVRDMYVSNPSLYPPPWEGAWEEYATRLESAIGGGIVAGPDNIDFVDAASGHMLLNQQFYNAILGRNWCWFYFNADGLLGSYSGCGSWGPLPSPDDELRGQKCSNCEIYSLHLRRNVGGALMLFGKEVVMHLTGCSEQDIRDSLMINDQDELWFCYGTHWEEWSTYSGIRFNPNEFPIVGEVKPEYDVLGCAAICRVASGFVNVIDEDTRGTEWFAAAKPFGTVSGLDGSVARVTEFKNLVTPAFTEVRLVPVDSVGGRDLHTADAEWMTHVKYHLPGYMDGGVSSIYSGCPYCKALQLWEQESFRHQGTEWLQHNAGSCTRSTGPGNDYGGTAHAH